MVVTCQIEFDNNPFGIYFAGQVLTGKITLTANKAKQVRGISLRISGFAYTHWTESRSRSTTDSKGKSTSRTETVHYSGREDYIASLTYLLGSDASESLTIAPGIHTYNFACHLPAACPSSFEGRYGYVRYLIRVALIRPWKFDQTFTKGFTVLKIMDLNYDSPLLRVPLNSEVQKTFCCGPCRSEPLKLEVNLAQTGYVPGQSIPVTLTVTNDSNVPVEEIKVSLIMLLCFYSQTPYSKCKNDQMTIAKMKGEGVLRHCKKQFLYELPVPATPPTCFNLCRIIQVAYQVNVEAKVKGMHASQVIAVPVTIGNVPLMGGGVIQQQPLQMMQRMELDNAATSSNGVSDSENVDGKSEMMHMKSAMNGAPSAPEIQRESAVQVAWSADANIPPPSYEEATHMPHACINDDEKHDYGEADFAPRYPVFNLAAARERATAPPQPQNGNDEIDAAGDASNGTWL